MTKSKKVRRITENLLVESSSEFIVESHEEVEITESVVEGTKEKSSVFLKLTGVFQKGNSPNGNNRIYKTELLARENDKFQSKIRQGTALGKGYHPGLFDQGGPAGLSDVTHRIVRTWMDGDLVRGELLVLKTSMGKNEVEPIISGGGKIGISSRGYGDLEYHEKYEIAGKTFRKVDVVGDNYELSTYDLVLRPSVKSAMMKQVKEEETDDSLNSNCNEENLEGGKNPMTIEELKSLHPELYNKVHESAVEEGSIKERKTVEVAHKTVIEEKDNAISILEKTNETLTSENAKLESKNKELVTSQAKVEADRLAVEVKTAVTERVEASEYKDYFKKEDMDFIVTKCTTVEDATAEVCARESVYESAIATFKALKTTDTRSKKADTSEANVNENKDMDAKKAFAESQRELAFG